MSDKKMTKREQQLIARQKRLKKELEQVSAEVQAREARRRQAAARKERVDDTRRKILIGACVTVEGVSEGLLARLDAYLERDDDRALFGLNPRSQERGQGQGLEAAAVPVGSQEKPV